MISIKKATSESRQRDAKRERLVLAIGEKVIHITKDEARQLQKDIKVALSKKKTTGK